MGELQIRIDEGLLTKLENLAQAHNLSLEDQINDVLRRALEGPSTGGETFAATARRITAMTPKGVKQIDSVEMLREDRNH
ncbi:MAG: hypothetical protein JWL86_3328 [Rhizobium sp.]|nr:hypothetical protein [Rhizobium sp.]